MSAGVRVDEAEYAQVQKSLQQLRVENLIDPVWSELAEPVMAEAQPYPPPVPVGEHFIVRKGRRGGRLVRVKTGMYQRTNTLLGEWFDEVVGHEQLIGNFASYASWLLRRPVYAWMYGWQRLRTVAKRRLPDFARFLEERAGQIWEGR